MKKIAFLINSLDNGGAEKVILTLMEALLNEKDIFSNIELIMLENNNFYSAPYDLKITYLSNFTGSESNIVKLFSLPLLAFRLKKYVKINKIEVVQSHLYRANYVNVLSRIFKSKHQVQLVNHDNFFINFRSKLMAFFYRKADIVIAISEYMKNELESLIKKKIVKINNPYNILDINNKSMENIFEFEFKDNIKYLISVGRLIKLKRHKDLIYAFQNVVERNNNIELIILGDGPEKENLTNLINDLNLVDKIHLLGKVVNPYKYLRNSHIFVLPSESEGFPNSLIEALCCGCLTISSDCISGPREILNENLKCNNILQGLEICKYGILYPVGHIDLLVSAIEIMLTNIEITDKLKRVSKNRASDFDVNIIKNEYIKILFN